MATHSARTPSSPWTPWIPVIAWFGVIAILGGTGFEYEQTSRFIGPLLEWLLPDWTRWERAQLHGSIRKTAHVAEYAVAAMLTWRALWLSGRATTRLAAALPTLGLVALVATADEMRQGIVETRTGSARDVALDVAGGAAGLFLAPWIVPRLGRRKRDDDGESPDGTGPHG